MDLLDSDALFNFVTSLVAKFYGWAIQPNNPPVSVKLASGKVGHSSCVANGLVSRGLWQADMTFLVLDVLFEVILCMP